MSTIEINKEIALHIKSPNKLLARLAYDYMSEFETGFGPSLSVRNTMIFLLSKSTGKKRMMRVMSKAEEERRLSAKCWMPNLKSALFYVIWCKIKSDEKILDNIFSIDISGSLVACDAIEENGEITFIKSQELELYSMLVTTIISLLQKFNADVDHVEDIILNLMNKHKVKKKSSVLLNTSKFIRVYNKYGESI
jgi:hypothetical protein